MAKTVAPTDQAGGSARAHLSEAKTDALDAAHELRAAAEATVDELRSTASDVMEQARGKAAAAADQARSTAEHTAQAAREAGQQAIDRSKDLATTAQSEFTRAVRDHPIPAVVGALGVGLLIGFSLRRS